MINKHGHKYIGNDKYGYQFAGTGNCKYCKYYNTLMCPANLGGNFNARTTCSRIDQRGYYYDGVEIKIHLFLNKNLEM